MFNLKTTLLHKDQIKNPIIDFAVANDSRRAFLSRKVRAYDWQRVLIFAFPLLDSDLF